MFAFVVSDSELLSELSVLWISPDSSHGCTQYFNYVFDLDKVLLPDFHSEVNQQRETGINNEFSLNILT